MQLYCTLYQIPWFARSAPSQSDALQMKPMRQQGGDEGSFVAFTYYVCAAFRLLKITPRAA
jgi:hypothetical protein